MPLTALLLLLAVPLAGCGGLGRSGLQNRIRDDTNRYVGTKAVQSVRCTTDHSVAGASYVCRVVPSNGRKAFRVFVAVNGSKYSILRSAS